jgi:hypothetical protein
VKAPWIAVLACTLISFCASAADQATAVAAKGQMLVAANGSRLGPVYRVAADGDVQMILGGKMVTVPASTLSSVEGRLTTSLSKSEVLLLH